MPIKSKNLILLTGAGFTHNFGGFLGREIWARIFNNPLVQGCPRVRDILAKSFDFEAAYFEIFQGSEFSEEEKNVMKQAVEQSYKMLDDAVKDWRQNDDNIGSLNMHANGGFGSLMNLFVGQGEEKGLFFTLNQDLFIERKFHHRSPGAPSFSEQFYNLGTELTQSGFVVLPAEAEMVKAKSSIDSMAGLVYIKIHGSYGWKSANGESRIVVGKNKSEDIKSEPLLKWYLEIFEETIRSGEKKLLVIGYGFRDEHINSLLLEGVRSHGLKLYIMNPTDPEQFRLELDYSMSHDGGELWKGVNGYFPGSLRTIFPPSQQETPLFREIRNALVAH